MPVERVRAQASSRAALRAARRGPRILRLLALAPRGVRGARRFALALLLLPLAAACSSAPDYRKPVEHVVPDRIRIRRPMSPPVDPKAGPGGVDYVPEQPPDSAFDCREVDVLFKDLKAEAVRECLRSLDGGATVRYLLFRHHLPEFRLMGDEKNPECLAKVLPTIPLPREVFFVVNEPPKRPACYSARIPVESDRMLGIRVPTDKVSLLVRFPLRDELETDADLKKLLTAWVLSPFFDPETGGRRILAREVPDAFCRRCFGGEDPFAFDGPPPPTWPSGGSAQKVPAQIPDSDGNNDVKPGKP